MRILREWIRRLQGTLFPGRRDAELEQEIQSHMEMAAEDATTSWSRPRRCFARRAD